VDTKSITITTTAASEATGRAESYLFDNFCELMTRVFTAFEEEEWAGAADWDIAFDQSVSDAEVAWKLVVIQAETVTAVRPISVNDLLLHRMAGLVSRAISATSLAALEAVRSRAMHCIAQAPTHIAEAVYDLAHEAQISIDQMIEHALTNGSYESPDAGLPLAA